MVHRDYYLVLGIDRDESQRGIRDAISASGRESQPDLEARYPEGKTMAKRQRTGASQEAGVLDLSHLRRETRTALELAVVALAPSELIDSLARVAGLLEAIAELPTDSAPVIALIPGLVRRAKTALQGWNTWHRAYLEKKIPRG